MTNVKKMLAAGLAAAAMLTAVLPAMAESGTQAPAMGQQQAMGGRGMRQGMPAGRGVQQGAQGSRQAMPGGMKGGRGMQQGQMPQQPDAASGATQKSGDAATGDTGSSTTQKPATGRGTGRGGRHSRIGFETLLKDGVIDQETYDAIQNYMKEKHSASASSEDAVPAPAEGEVPPEMPAEGEVPPEMPADGEVPPAKPEGEPAGEDPVLAGLLQDGVITQEQYDAILAARAAAQPADSAADAAEAAE
ncbi:MAG: hypothetical protein IJ175_10370, partial [Clostridia bacterium]|nr:hypothetical protein [Clostridia bacterium]